jgi:hypothetical protein
MAPSRCPLVVKGQPDQQPVVVAEAASQRLAQLGELLAQLALGQLRQDLGVALPADEGGQHGPARDAQVCQWRPRPCLMPASSSVFWTRWHSALWAWIRRLR